MTVHKKVLLYVVFYAVAVSAVVFAKTHRELGLWWLSPLLYTVMSWPFFIKYHCGKFQFAFPREEAPFEPKEEKDLRVVVADKAPKRRGPGSLELLRQADAAARKNENSDIDLSDIPLPPGKWKTNYPPKKDQAKVTTSKPARVSVSQQPVPPAPAAPDASPSEEPSDEVHNFWNEKNARRSRRPDEFSLPLFPEEEATLNANVSQQDDFFL
ncbi:hypothetical protein [Ralstonia pseudosolanacearum]|uniref:hypothetical protein n=1 Tax=Ralstonia pseudosolanacearum TaxID=1310165 RepID=UPI003CED6FA8